MPFSIKDTLNGWAAEDLENLGKLLGLEVKATVPAIEDRFKWLYHSKVMANAEVGLKDLISKVYPSKESNKSIDDARHTPSYEELVYGACKHMKTLEEGATLQESELFLSIAVIVLVLSNMKPRERVAFFSKPVNITEITNGTNIKDKNFTGSLTTMAMLGAAQASGFGVFAASTTALGFLTHAVGITLPFVAYTGLTSSIAFIIGPAGWLAAGAFGAWQFTKAEWKLIIPALVYIISRNSSK